MEEIWRDVRGYEGIYSISDQGRAQSFLRAKPAILKPFSVGPKPYQYQAISLCGDGGQTTRKVHLLVLHAFVGPKPEDMQGCHRDDNRLNNALENLYWGTPSQNVQDIILNGNHFQLNKTHCPQDHPYDETNTYHIPSGGRGCKTCRYLNNRKRDQAKSLAKKLARSVDVEGAA